MEPSISFRLNAVDARGLRGQFRHDFRTGKQPSYVDATRAHLNASLHRSEGFDDIASARQKILERTKRKTTAEKYWRTAILTFSHDAQTKLSGNLPHDEAKAVFADFADRHGVKLLSVDFHGDESAPHYHATFEGITEAGYALRLNKAELSQEQDHAAAKFADLGLTRGKRKSKRIADGEDASKWVNRSVKELHDQLPGELDALRAKVEKNERLAEKARAKADEETERGRKAARNAERYEQRAEDAKKALAEREKKLGEGRLKRLFRRDPEAAEQIEAAQEAQRDAESVAKAAEAAMASDVASADERAMRAAYKALSGHSKRLEMREAEVREVSEALSKREAEVLEALRILFQAFSAVPPRSRLDEEQIKALTGMIDDTRAIDLYEEHGVPELIFDEKLSFSTQQTILKGWLRLRQDLQEIYQSVMHATSDWRLNAQAAIKPEAPKPKPEPEPKQPAPRSFARDDGPGF